MKLNYDRKSKNPTYFIQMGVRNGKSTTTKNVYTIGKHNDLLKITDDPLAYAKQKVIEYNEQFKNGKVDFTVKVDFDKKLPFSDNIASKSTATNIGYFILQQMYHDLHIKKFIDSLQKDTKIEFDCNEINRFLTFCKIIDPGSKLHNINSLPGFYEKPDFSHQQALRFMDLLIEHSDEYLEYLYKASTSVIPRDTSVVYYDCTNFYSETECADEDSVDNETGEVIKGLRKYGVSKENRPNPIVEMGLMVDKEGIPISMCIHPGNTSEQTTAVPVMKSLIKMGIIRFVYCADSGIGSFNIRQFASMGGRAFVVSQSVKKMSKELQDLAFKDENYKLLSNNKHVSLKSMKEFDVHDPSNKKYYDDVIYKVLPANKAVDLGLYELKELKNGTYKKVKAKGTLEQYVIITFSRKYMEYQRAIRNKQVERAKNLLATATDPDQIKKGPNDIRRFLKKTDKDGKALKDQYRLDEEKIAEEEKYDGFYAVASNLDDTPQEILKISSQRNVIEDRFRTMKSNMDGRPYYHRLEDRIKANFLFTYTALLILSILEKKLDMDGTHFTHEQVIETLQNMKVQNHQDLYYESIYTASKVNTAINKLYGLGLDKQYYSPSDLSKKVKKLQ